MPTTGRACDAGGLERAGGERELTRVRVCTLSTRCWISTRSSTLWAPNDSLSASGGKASGTEPNGACQAGGATGCMRFRITVAAHSKVAHQAACKPGSPPQILMHRVLVLSGFRGGAYAQS
eukprot:13793144-Alexandrium_andersonii.AAC.1